MARMPSGQPRTVPDPAGDQYERDMARVRAQRQAEDCGLASPVAARGAGPGQLKPNGRPLPEVGPGARQLLAFIARAEGTSGALPAHHGYTSDYDVTFNYGRSDPPGRTKPLSQMTLDEVGALQAQMGGGSRVTGRYQIGPVTMAYLRTKHGLTGKEPYDADHQDRFGRSLMQRRGYGAYCAGRLSADEVMDGFAKEWASLPNADGNSYHHFGQRRQPVRTTRGELKAAIDAACRADLGR